MRKLFEIGRFLFIRRRKTRIAPHCEKIEMDAEKPLGMTPAEHRADESAPVAALRGETLVPQFAHQLDEDLGNLLYAEARLARPERKRVAGQRRRDDRKALCQERDQPPELDDRARPAVREQERDRFRTPARLVDEVQLDAADGDRE